MSFHLEELLYQRRAMDAVHRILEAQQRNYFIAPLNSDCFPNELDLSAEDIAANVRRITAEYGISGDEAGFSAEPDYCIEMETGTGKTIVYLRSIYELCREYGFTKFIIFVPSVPIRECVLDSIERYRTQLERLYSVRLLDEKEAAHLAFLDGEAERAVFDEVLLKNRFRLDWTRERRDDFPNSTVYRVSDGEREALVCLAWSERLHDSTLKRLRQLSESGDLPFFICLERSLDTTAKWNLKHLLGKHLVAF